jgi:SAM-dependent methyltransferase
MPDQQFWDAHYQQNDTGWDLGMISAPLKAYFDQLAEKSLRILIPGAGMSYEARYLAEQGFTDVTIIDIAPTAVQRVTEAVGASAGQAIKIIQGDFFSLKGTYDLIIEQTFFCAIDPERRNDYARQCHELLGDKGKLVGLLFNRDFEPGHPPFGGDSGLYEQIFSPYFNFKTWQSCYNSNPARAGWEWFMILEKKS